MKHLQSNLLAIVIAVQCCSCTSSSTTGPGGGAPYNYRSLDGCQRAELRYEGIAKGHRRLGNWKVTTEGRTGKLVWNQVIENNGRKTEAGGSIYETKNQASVDGVSIGSSGISGGPGTQLAGGGARPDAIDGNSMITEYRMNDTIGGIQDLVREKDATRTFHKSITDKPINTPAGPAAVKRVYSVTPNATTIVVAGKSITVALFTEKIYNSEKLDKTEEVYVNDSIPGRIVREVVQKYATDGITPLGRTELTLASWSVN